MITVGELVKNVMVELDKQPMASVPSFTNDELKYFIAKAYVSLIRQKCTGNNALRQGYQISPQRLVELAPLMHQFSSFNYEVPFDDSPDAVHGYVGAQPTAYPNKLQFIVRDEMFTERLFIPIRAEFSWDNSSHNTDKLPIWEPAIIMQDDTAFQNLAETSENYPYIVRPVITFNRHSGNYLDIEIADQNGVLQHGKLYYTQHLDVYVDSQLIRDRDFWKGLPQPEDYDSQTTVTLRCGKAAITIIGVRFPFWVLGDTTSNISDDSSVDVDWTDEIVSLAVDMLLDNIQSPRLNTHSQIVTAKLE
jgi:hypothetical protein